jgi:CRISPR-associated protein Cst1
MFFNWTGNPFVDNGIGATLAHASGDKEEPDELTLEDVERMGELILRVYLTPAWQSAMQNIFPNGAFTNGAYAKPPGKRREVVTALTNFLVSEIKPLEVFGGCMCCGRRAPLRLEKNDTRKLPNNMVLSKTYVPLNGGVLNFFPAGVYGADVCAACVFAIQCAPLNFYTCNTDEKRFFAVHANDFGFLRDWSEEAKDDVKRQLASDTFTGPFNEGVNNAHNAFFHIVDKVMSHPRFAFDERGTSVRLYHFDNYNQPKAQPLKMYDMPAPVFRFLAEAKNSRLNDAWRSLVRRNYYFEKNKKVIPLALSEEQEAERKTTRNLVLEKLLRGESIVSRFYGRRRTYAPWELLHLYLREVRAMPDERTETIKRVADEISEFIRATNDKRRLLRLEVAPNYASFRNQLRLIIRDRLRAQNSKPLFTYDEYVDHLFPQGALNWRETQDLLLFRLYERLAGYLKPEDLGKDARESDGEGAPDAPQVLADGNAQDSSEGDTSE